ncbi:hypothetical protein CL89_gp253 [Aeromonas phage PX29]|uniref:Uncharacterized protein n=1 Tax=Aeromonas phage PX29 TaxID=926067 RepID=E5DQF8_9CAUD|nr:hypothetical protein CL89_gp253 [Aeromonas phage PX29]ADQ52944.1 conserved hypothetical protein [Aeromonas phage PX29]
MAHINKREEYIMKIKIDELFLEKFKERMNKLARIAAKMGIAAPTFEIVDTEYVRDDKIDAYYKRFIIEITGEAPKMPGGWTFVAKINHEENLTYGVREISQKYRNVSELKCSCDHCNTNRYRANTFIITDDEKFMQVGGSCLKHYMGHVNPSSMIAFFEEMKDLDNEESYGSTIHRIAYTELDKVICAAVTAIKRFGYVKAEHGSEDNVPTRCVVDNILNSPKSVITMEDIKEFESHVIPCSQFMMNMKPFGDGSYSENVKQIAKNGHVSSKAMGYAVSAVACYLRDLDKENERKIKEKVGQNSNHIGNVAERLRGLQLTVIGTKAFETMYGTTTIVNMIDTSGNIFVWFASGYREFDKNEEIQIAGTVKEHREYNGTKQTVLTRCKFE